MTVSVGADDTPASGPGAGTAGDAPVDPGSRVPATRSTRDVVGGVCPYLTSTGGSWRIATPSRHHRCAALEPPAAQPTDKQRRHCLSPDHAECSVFRAARAARVTTLAAGADPVLVGIADARRRPLARTSPILMEPPRLVDRAIRLEFDRAPGQLALIGLMVVAFAIVALTRLSGGAGPVPSGSPAASLVAAASAGPTPAPTRSVVPTDRPSASAPASQGPAASTFRTYKVKRGDSLLGIAKHYGTTAAKIKQLNGLTTSTLKIGQVLKIP